MMIGARIGRIVTLVAFVACSGGDEHIGVVSSAITIPDPDQQTTLNGLFLSCPGMSGPGNASNETSSEWSVSGRIAAWGVGMNDMCQPVQQSAGWSRAVDNANLVWSYCNFSFAAPNGCGPGGGAVGTASGAINGTPVTQTDWRGDPFVVSTRTNPDVVVYTNIADSNQPGVNADMVVGAVSWDTGVTFSPLLPNTPTIYVNEGHCNQGTMDQQAATFDTSTWPPRLWVVWRWKSQATYGACTQHFDIDPIAQTVLPTPDVPQEVQNLDRAPFYGVGGVAVLGGSGRVTVIYSNSDHHWNCPDAPDKEMKWFSVNSDDAGYHWSSSHLIRRTQTYAPCQAGNNVSNEMRTFGFVRDNSGNYYVALPTGKNTIEVLQSTDRGDTWGTPQPNPDDGYLPFKVIGPPGDTTAGSRFFPTIASDQGGRLAINYYTTDFATDMQVTPMFIAMRSPPTLMNPTGTWDPETPLDVAFPIDLWLGNCLANTNNCRTLGDYLGMAAKPRTQENQKTYLPAWAQFPRGQTSAPGFERVFATRVVVN